MNLYFILVEPSVSGNIGAAARAMKTMGHSNFILINPAPHLNDHAKMMGHGSWDVLQHAQIFPSFKQAIGKMDFIIGTSAKNRRVKHDYYPVEKTKAILKKKKGTVQHVALVFGREESGLTNDELQLCDIISYIPMATTYPSLNLAQAVMLFAYAFADVAYGDQGTKELTESQSIYSIAKTKTSNSLEHIGIEKNATLHNRIMERLALLKKDDLHLVLSVCKGILGH